MAAATAVIFHVAFSKQIPRRDEKKGNNKFIPLAGVANAAAAESEVLILHGGRKKKYIIHAKHLQTSVSFKGNFIDKT